MERIEIKAAFAVDEAGAITGTAWPFGAPDRTGDVITPQAFAGAVGKTLPMLAGHTDPVGVWSSITTDTEGLKVAGRLLIDDVPEAKATRALVKAGAVTGLSIGFMTRKAAPRKGGGRTISDLELLEVSIVAVPANAGARITSAKELAVDRDEQGAAPEIAAIEGKLGEIAETVKGLPAIVQRLEAVEKKANRPVTGAPGDLDGKAQAEAERKGFAAYLRKGNQAPADELKTLVVSTDPQGGYLAPAEMASEMIRDITEVSPIRALASVRTTTAPSVSYPKRTGITNGKWKGETQTSEESEPAFGQVEIPVREINTYVDLSNQLLADSAGQAEAEVRLALAEDFGAKEGLSFVKGASQLEPEGLLTASGVGYVATGNATTLGSAPADKIIDLFYGLKAAYRNRGTWLMNGTTLAAIRKLKDATSGLYLWQPSLAAGQPETILGRPVVEVPDMPDVGSAAEPIAFGDFATAYRIVDRLGLSILVNPYLLATTGITRIHATRRVGAAVVQPAAFKKLRCATS